MTDARQAQPPTAPRHRHVGVGVVCMAAANAGAEPRPEAGARHERTLEAVRYSAWFGWVCLGKQAKAPPCWRAATWAALFNFQRLVEDRFGRLNFLVIH